VAADVCSRSCKVSAEMLVPPVRELSAGETHLAHRAMSALRPAYDNEQEFVEYVDAVLRPAGYRLMGVFDSSGDQALAAAGFRILDSLALGHHLCLDDLSTVPEARHQGHAGRLLDRILDEARRVGANQVHLDSVTGPERFAAHRLYHKHGFAIYAHHFARRA
jgi:GNAT superfamily N-acetyltransferase